MTETSNLLISALGLGIAVFGVVEVAKWTPLGTIGFGRIRALLGEPLFSALSVAYGPRFESLLRGQYREGRREFVELKRSLRRGIQLGLNESNALEMAKCLGVVKPYELASTAIILGRGQELTLEERNVIARFQVAVDARVRAALCEARARYVGMLRLFAAILAIGLAQVAAPVVESSRAQALLIGVAAVPLAPVISDLVNMLQEATLALRLRRT